VHRYAIRTESAPESVSCIVPCVAVFRLRNAKVPLGSAGSVYVQCCPYCHVWLCPCCHVWCNCAGGLLVFIIPGLFCLFGRVMVMVSCTLPYASTAEPGVCNSTCVRVRICYCFITCMRAAVTILCRALTHMACFCGGCKLRPGLLPCPVRQLLQSVRFPVLCELCFSRSVCSMSLRPGTVGL
jgi:hypothetical protein